MLRTIKDNKATEEGMTLMIETVRRLVEKEIPIKRAEVFDKVFYLQTVRRKNDESMQKFIIRRHKEFAELKDISADTAISDDIKAHLLLRFAGISRQERAQIIASTGNSFDLKHIEAALRTQFGDVHVHRGKGKGQVPQQEQVEVPRAPREDGRG